MPTVKASSPREVSLHIKEALCRNAACHSNQPGNANTNYTARQVQERCSQGRRLWSRALCEVSPNG